MMATTYRKKPIRSLENKNTLTSNLIASLSRISGFTEEDIRKSRNHHQVFWRRIGIWILMEDYGWTNQAVADVFNTSPPNIFNSFKIIDKLLNDKMRRSSILPYINRVTDDLTL